MSEKTINPDTFTSVSSVLRLTYDNYIKALKTVCTKNAEGEIGEKTQPTAPEGVNLVWSPFQSKRDDFNLGEARTTFVNTAKIYIGDGIDDFDNHIQAFISKTEQKIQDECNANKGFLRA